MMALQIFESKDEMDGSLVKISHDIAFEDWDRYFEKIVGKDEFYNKFRLGSCCVYASSLYFVLILRKINFIPLYRPLIKFGAKLLKRRKKIIFVGAFITLVDEVVDNIFTNNKKEQLEEVIFDNSKVDGKLKILRYISQELIKMGADLRPILEWAKGEEKNCNGKKDPEGLCFRKFGILYINKLMVWAINGNKKEKNILEKAAFLIQMVDDVIDIEEDKKNYVNTPAIEGIWDEETFKKQFIDLRECIHSTVKSKKKSKEIEKAVNWKMNWIITTLEENKYN